MSKPLKILIKDLTKEVQGHFENLQREFSNLREAPVNELFERIDTILEFSEWHRNVMLERLETFTRENDPDFLDQSTFMKVSTMAVFETLINLSSEGSPDYEEVLKSIIYKIVYPPVMYDQPAYYIHRVDNQSLMKAIESSKRILAELRELADDRPLTDPEIYESLIEDTVPLVVMGPLLIIYGNASDKWCSIQPYPLESLRRFKDEPLEIPVLTSAFSIYRANFHKVNEKNGLKEFLQNYG